MWPNAVFEEPEGDIMNRRGGPFLLGFVLILSTWIGIGVAAGALAFTTYNTCPDFTTFKADVEAISGTGTIAFTAAGCSLTSTSTISIQAGSTVIIDGHGLTLSGGTAGSPGAFDMLAVGSAGSLTLDKTTIQYGAIGIHLPSGGSVTLTSSTVNGNGIDGISQSSNGNAALTNSNVSDNGNDGINQGANGSITLTNSTMTHNGFDGIFQGSGNITLTESTMSDNVSSGIRQVSGNTILTNSTISGNGSNGIRQVGFSSATLTYSTVTGNGGTGILQVSDSNATLTATLLAGNAGNCSTASLTDQGYNLSDDASCGFSATGSQNSVSDADLSLGTLGDYGGPTQTIPLLPGSIALDAIPTGSSSGSIVCLDANGQPILDPSTNQPVITDQRGTARPQGLGCDVGAFEAAIPSTTSRGSLTILNLFPTSVRAVVLTGFGNTPRGSLTYRDSQVSLSNVHFQSLVVSGSNATLYGTANANGNPVNFVLTASTSQRTVRLQLSNGYDSGPQSVWIVFVH